MFVPVISTSTDWDKYNITILKCMFFFVFRLEVKEERIQEDGSIEVLVHYQGWPRTYDEWRKKEDIVDITPNFVESNAYTLLKTSITVQVKEALNGGRLLNPEVTLRFQVQQDTFELLKKDLNPEVSSENGCMKYRLRTLTQADELFGKNWWLRILNVHGDCCYISAPTFHFWIFERTPLVEYTLSGSSKLIYRGTLLCIRFVRECKSKKEMPNFMIQ